MKDNNNSLAVPNLTIPPEAMEKAARAMKDAVIAELLDPIEERAYRIMADAAIRAALAAWPGMHTHEWQRPWLGGMSGTDIILPLTEPRDE